MPTATISLRGRLGESNVKGEVSLSADSAIQHNPTLNMGYAGTLSTRTNNTEGTITLANGHGILTGDTVAVFWAAGSRYGVAVGTVAGTSVPISGGDITNLPLQGTAVIVCKETEIDTQFDGDNLVALSISCTSRIRFALFDENDALVLAEDIPAGAGYVWHNLLPWSSPAGSSLVESITVAQAGTDGTVPIDIGILHNAS